MTVRDMVVCICVYENVSLRQYVCVSQTERLKQSDESNYQRAIY